MLGVLYCTVGIVLGFRGTVNIVSFEVCDSQPYSHHYSNGDSMSEAMVSALKNN